MSNSNSNSLVVMNQVVQEWRQEDSKEVKIVILKSFKVNLIKRELYKRESERWEWKICEEIFYGIE